MSPASCSTSATTRPEGTSIVTGTILLSVAVILPVSTPPTPTPILPCPPPHAGRDRPVPTRSENPILVQKEDTKVGPVVVGGNNKPAVHIGVPAWFVAEKLSQSVEPVGTGLREATSLRTGHPAACPIVNRDDAEWLGGRVVVLGAD